MVTVLQVERLGLGWRLTDLLDSVLQADLECLLVMTVAVYGDPATLAPVCGTQRLGPNSLIIRIIIGWIFIWKF